MSRLRSNYYTTEERKHAKQAAWLMALYPAAYVMCTLPLASARMMALAGTPPSIRRLCVAGGMVTSNGWIDVLVYSLTRRISLLGHDPPPEDCGIATFAMPFWTDPLSSGRFGTVTTIEATGALPGSSHQHKSSFFKSHELRSSSEQSRSRCASQHSTHGSMDELVRASGKNAVHTETTVDVRSEPLELDDIQAMLDQRRVEERALRTRDSNRNSKEKEDYTFSTIPAGYR